MRDCSVFYTLLAYIAYHLYTEKESLERRAIKVAQIEHGEADRFFKEVNRGCSWLSLALLVLSLPCAQVDFDGDRHTDKHEMKKFVTSYGFDVELECFDLAFDQSVKYDGENGVLPEPAYTVALLCNCAHPSIHTRTLSCAHYPEHTILSTLS